MTLNEWRSYKGLTLRQAAKLLSVSAATLCRIEQGKQPAWDTACRIHDGSKGRVKRDELMTVNGSSA